MGARKKKSKASSKRRWGRRLIQSIILSLVVYGIVVGVMAIGSAVLLDRFVMPLLVMHGNESPIPDVVGSEFSQAATILRESGFDPRRMNDESHPEYQKGLVVNQDPPPGHLGKPSRPIRLVVSSGPANVTIPYITGYGCREALNMLSTAGLFVGDIIMYPRPGTPTGEVIATFPPSGTPLLIGGEVDLLIAEPGRDDCFIMPSFNGSNIGDTFRELRKRGIGISQRHYIRNSGEAEGTVLSVFPPPGYKICPGESVTVVVTSS